MEERAPETFEQDFEPTHDKSSGRYVLLATIALLTIVGVIAWFLLSEPDDGD